MCDDFALDVNVYRFADCIMFLIGSVYFVAGSYPNALSTNTPYINYIHSQPPEGIIVEHQSKGTEEEPLL